MSRSCRQDVHPKLIQAAHAVFQHKSKANSLFKWAWQLALRKGRKIAVVAVARKIVVSAFYLLNGKPFKAKELTRTLNDKIKKLAKEIGMKELRRKGYETCQKFIDEKLSILQYAT